MMNSLKRAIFFVWFHLDRKIAIKRGKHRISRLLTSVLGMATYRVGPFKLDLNPHEFFWRNFMLGKLTDSDVQQAISKYLGEGGVFIDIGANIGYFSLFAAIDRKAHVFAFEPSQREIARISRNIALNNASNRVILFPFGISERNEELSLNISPLAHPGMNSVLDLSDVANVETQETAVFYSLGDLLSDQILKRVSVCKIDVEGFEPMVLKGIADKMPLMLKAVFIVEISPEYLEKGGYSKDFIYTFFEKYGFVASIGKSQPGQYNEIFSREE
jgi:FkbM family methyltransferase